MNVLLFLRPDIVRHVHELWRSGKAEVKVTRGFVIQDVNQKPPFIMLGVRSILDYIQDWKIDADALRVLQRIPSLQRLEPEFWEYLGALRIRGDIRALPDGTGITQRITHMDDDGDDWLPLLYMTDAAAAIALTSFAITAMLDAQIAYGRLLYNYVLEERPPIFWMSERVSHPSWAKLAAEAEWIMDHDGLLDARDVVWLMWQGRPPTTFSDEPPLPGGVVPSQLSAKTKAEVRFLVSAPVELHSKPLGERDGRSD